MNTTGIQAKSKRLLLKNSMDVLSEKHFYSAYSLSMRGYKEGTVICILAHDGVL